MIANAERYTANHQRIRKRADEAFTETRRTNHRHTVAEAAKQYARDGRQAIKRRDGIAAILAAQCAHIRDEGPA